METHGKIYSITTKAGKIGILGLAVVGAVTIAKKIANGEIKVSASVNKS